MPEYVPSEERSEEVPFDGEETRETLATIAAVAA
jgi:hypothetical protein